jgi:hypothetical protein
MTIKGIFRAIKRSDELNRGTNSNKKPYDFQWIGSDGWADRQDVVDDVEIQAAGSLSV